jgi:hypothetical protein
MVSAAVACLPAAVNLLLLEALFIQISGVSLALTWPCRLCLLRVLLCASLCYKLSPFQAHWWRWHCTCFLRPVCLFTVHVGSGSSPLSCGIFLPLPLSQAFLLLVACHVPLLLLSLAGPSLFIYSSGRDSSLPLFSAQGTPPSLLHVFIVLIAYYSVSLFFPGWGSVFPGGYAALAQGCLWEYRVPLNSPCGLHLPKPSGRGCLAVAPGALLVSPFNVKWRCSAQTGGVEGSTFCLFSVALPARCVFSVSPRFYFRRHTFCFLPLAAILESPQVFSLYFIYLHLDSTLLERTHGICLSQFSWFLLACWSPVPSISLQWHNFILLHGWIIVCGYCIFFI